MSQRKKGSASRDALLEEKNSEGEDQHILISYCWKQQELALKIFNRLKQCGKKVSMDIDGQTGDICLVEMAEAVDNASFVICCFSEDYKNSRACQSEAKYACHIKKKNLVFAKMEQRYEPNGWLGILIGANIYYNLYDADRFDKEFTKMINYINKKSGASNIISGKPDHEDDIPVSVDENTLNNSVEENQESDLENGEYDSDDSSEDSEGSDCSIFSALDTTEKLEDYVNKFFLEIKNCDPATDDVSYSINRLNKLTSECNCREKMKHLGNHLNKLKFVELLDKWMKLPRNNRKILWENITECIGILVELTDASVTVCESVVKLKFHENLIKVLSKLAFELEVFEKMKAKEAKLISEKGLALRCTVTNFFLVLYNVMRIYLPSRVEFREDGIVYVCLRYLQSQDLEIKTMALISLSFAADLDKSSELIQATELNLLFLLKEIEECFRSEDHKGFSGFSFEELMNCFSQLAKNRNNAIEMTRMGILKICMEALEAKFNDAEIKWTLHLVWSLCFVDEIKNKMLDCKMLEKVSSYVNISNKDIAEAVRGIIWELGQKTKESENALVADDIEERNSEVDQHIMISYCWKQQELAKEIFNRLKQCGKKVWLDIDGKMEGDSLQKMAEAVENSSFVICCFSEDYKNSQNCRSEAIYAYKQKKNIVFAKMEPQYEPNGWLGILLGADIYYHLYDAERFDNEFTNMLNYINNKSGVLGSGNITSGPSFLKNSILSLIGLQMK